MNSLFQAHFSRFSEQMNRYIHCVTHYNIQHSNHPLQQEWRRTGRNCNASSTLAVHHSKNLPVILQSFIFCLLGQLRGQCWPKRFRLRNKRQGSRNSYKGTVSLRLPMGLQRTRWILDTDWELRDKVLLTLDDSKTKIDVGEILLRCHATAA